MKRLTTLLTAAVALASASYGQALTPDVTFAPTEAEAALFTVSDNNHDGVTWGLHDEQKTNKVLVFNSNTYVNDNASSELPFDDWLFLPALNFTDASALYEVGLDAARGTFSSFFGVDEVFEIRLGNAPNATAMTQQVMAQTHLTLENNKDGKLRHFSELFSVPSAGEWYIGIHMMSSNSKSLGIYVANISVTRQQATVTAPGAVQSLGATAGVNGALTASVVFHMPTTDISGNPLPSDAVIRAEASSGVDTKSTTGAPGQVCVIADIATVQGVNEITVMTYIGDNGGKPATCEVYTGVSIPGPVVNTRVVASEDNMTLRFEWDAPVLAADGRGAVLPTGNTYTVYEELMNNVMGIDTYYWNKVGDLPLDQTWYEAQIPADGLQRRVKIGVVASNAAGVNNQVVTPIAGLGGRPYTLPMIEDFTGCSDTEFNYNPILNWDVNTDYTGQTFTVNDPAIIDQKYNIHHKPVLIFSNHIGTRTRVAFPKFSTAGIAAPTVKMMVYMGDDTPDLSLYAQTYGGEWQKISDIAVDRDANTYRLVSIPLGEACADKPWVYVAVDGYFDPAQYQIGFVSEYTILNSLDIDLGIYEVEGESPVVGEISPFGATIYNPGNSTATLAQAHWSVLKGEDILASGNVLAAPESLDPLTMEHYTWDFTPDASMLGKAQMRLEITVDADGDPANNVATLPIMIKSGGKVTVSDLCATAHEAGVTLTWTEPAAHHMVEGFESEEPFMHTPATIAGFTNYDGDQYQCWNFGEKDPIGGAPEAFTVWDATQLKNSFALIYPAAGGERYVMARCPGDELAIPPVADDWLISPAIASPQYISFDARPISTLYGSETLEVLCSFSGDAVEDFELLETFTVTPTTEIVAGEETLKYVTYHTEIPAGATRFALRYRSHDVFGIMIDNIEYAPAQGNGITGYDIYRNGSLHAASVPAGGSYTDPTALAGYSYSYAVKPLTANGKTALSNIVTTPGQTSLTAVDAAPSLLPVTWYNLQGQPVADPTLPGIYLRRQGTTVTKLHVR